MNNQAFIFTGALFLCHLGSKEDIRECLPRRRGVNEGANFDSPGYRPSPHTFTIDRAGGPLSLSAMPMKSYENSPAEKSCEFRLLGKTVSSDVPTGQATMCYLPGIETPERECWYINMGAVQKDFFTTEAMVQAAQ